MQIKKNRVMGLVITLLAVVGLSFGLFLSQHLQRVPKPDMAQFHGTWLDKPRDVAAFDLMSTQGVLTQASLKHHWTMLFFGFTACSSICPTTMLELNKMVRLLESQGISPLPQVVMVSLDPERDTVSRLQHYVSAFNPHFIGASSANEDGVKAMADEMGVAVAKISSPDDKKTHYNIDHSGTVMLFNPQGKLAAFFTMPHQAVALAEDYRLALTVDMSS